LAERLNGKFVRALYSPTEINGELLRDLRASTDGLKNELSSNGRKEPAPRSKGTSR
jgi:hypothetical protein